VTYVRGGGGKTGPRGPVHVGECEGQGADDRVFTPARCGTKSVGKKGNTKRGGRALCVTGDALRGKKYDEGSKKIAVGEGEREKVPGLSESLGTQDKHSVREKKMK